MSSSACGKEELCLVAESAYAAAGYSEYMTDEEIEQCSSDRKKFIQLRLSLANRSDADRSRGD